MTPGPIRVSPATNRAIREYLGTHRSLYTRRARELAPDYGRNSVQTRVAFAILSANTGFEAAVKGLAYCHTTGWRPDPFVLGAMGHIPAKAAWVRAMGERDPDSFLRVGLEPWNAYRQRVRWTTPGLGLAKASFAVSLLYPLEADVVCLDSWMQRLLWGHPGFERLSLPAYQRGEAWVRRWARRFCLPLFPTQWAIWDHQRGTVTSHDIFPGGHKV